ncbi:MAG: nitrilase-related carbon-nitrogen hydrolase [Bacteroidota bacterium]
MVHQLKSLLLLVLLALISGLLISLAWPGDTLVLFLFIGLIPLLFAIDKIALSDSRIKFLHLFLIAFITHYTWTSLSLGWLKASSPKTFQLAILIDAVTFALIFLPTFAIRKNLGIKFQWVYTISSWMALEFINQQWAMGAPYFVIGGGFGMYPQMIQFYSITGIEGGSLLVLLSNLGGYLVLKNTIKKQAVKKSMIILTIGLAPFVLSMAHLFDYEIEGREKVKVAAVHSFIETYADDSHAHPEKTINFLWDLTNQSKLDDVELVLWPETVIFNLGWVTNLQGDSAYKSLMEKMKSQTTFSLCTGGYSYSAVPKNEDDPYIAHEKARNIFYKAHNVALTIDTIGLMSIRGKEQFIPFQERIPLLKQLPFLKNWVDFVGANTMVCPYEQSEEVHKTMNGTSYVPVLCFESTYPLKMAKHAVEGELVVILANENWNKDLSGSDQYLYSNVAIAIQSRTSIARSSNSGTSAMIDPSGKILTKRKGRQAGVLIAELPLKEDATIYELMAGTLYKTGLTLAAFLLIWSTFKQWMGRTKKH